MAGWMDAVIAAAQIASQTAAARAQANAAKAAAQTKVDALNQGAASTDKSLDLNALSAAQNAANARAGGILNEQELALSAPRTRAQNSVRGSVLANAQDVQISGLPKGVTVPTITGGLRPSMFSGDTRALGQQMTKDALLSQMAPQVTPYSDLKPFDASSIINMKTPGATPLPQPSGLDNILAAIGQYGSFAGAAAPFLQPQKPKPTTTLPSSPASGFDPSTGLPVE